MLIDLRSLFDPAEPTGGIDLFFQVFISPAIPVSSVTGGVPIFRGGIFGGGIFRSWIIGVTR